MRTTFRSLRVRNYRLFASGQLVSLSGTWMQTVGQDWLVLQLGGHGLALGTVIGLQFLPMLLFGMYGGMLADRYNKRRVLLAAQSAFAVLAVALGTLVALGVVELWMVFVFAFLLGIVTAVDLPTRQSFVVEMVGPDDLINAVSLNSATFNAARIIGPALGGVVIGAAGVAPVFFANGLSYVAVIAGLLAMREAELHRARPAARGPGQLRAGLRYVVRRKDLLLPIALVGIVGTFGFNFQIVLALMAQQVFHAGARTYGMLSSVLAAGAVAGALISARRRTPRMALLVGSAVAFGLLELVVGLMPNIVTFVALLLPTGTLMIFFATTANATVQLGAGETMRGRVMALYGLVFIGGTPLGGPTIGWLSQQFGPRAGLLFGGAITAVASTLIGYLLMRDASRAALAHPRRFIRSLREPVPQPAVYDAAVR